MSEELTRAEGIARRTISKLPRAQLGYIFAGLGLGGIIAYLIARQRRTRPREATGSSLEYASENVVDDRGTTQKKAAQMLRNLRDRGFESSDERVALALGRTATEFEAISSGRETIDDDLIMKARGVALHRGIRIE